MIKAKFHYNPENDSMKMRIRGHASYAPKGEDLICAGVSALALNLGQAAQILWEQGYLKRPPLVRLCDGDALVIVTPLEEHLESVAMVFWTMQTGIYALQRRYSRHVQLEEVLKI